MSTPERSSFAPYIRQLADRLGLRDWAFHILDETVLRDDSDAEVHCIEGRKLARLRLSEDFLRSDAQNQRHTLTHELIHCQLAAGVIVAEKLLSASERSLFMLSIEYGVDGLADAVAPLMPLPPKPKPARNGARA
jgi:hypothetical protein